MKLWLSCNVHDFLVIILLKYKGQKFTPFVIPYEKLKEKGISDRATLIDQEGNVYYSSRKEKNNGNGFEKQAIPISTLGKENIFELFKVYLSNFNSIKT